MPELAKAYVQIIPSAEGIKGNLSRIMDGEAESAGKSAGGKFGSTFGSVAKAGLAAAGAGIAAASAGVVKIAKDSVAGFADYEQLTGGIETLFGAGGKSFEEYAATAKATARDIENSGIDWGKYAGAAWMEGGGVAGLFEEMQYNFDDLKTSADEVAEYLHFEYDLDIEDAQKAIEAYQKASDSEKIQKNYESLMAVQETMMSNAANAFKTAGISANDYMEMAIQSGASMISSVDGDTARAAELMDLAITDMSDNVNKMGSSMESVQNAYRGFAKGNFTMLDNLALGYGGTKEEMGRLLEDAEKIAGLDMFTFNINSYADIVEAIHIVQDNLGITGTTAKEASETISGSFSSMKSAWQNLLVGMADPAADLSGLIGNVVDTAETAFGNILPVAEQALVGIATFVEEIAPIIAEKLPGIVEAVLPSVLNAATSLFTSLVAALPTIMQVLVEQGPVIIQSVLDAALTMLPEIISLGLTLIISLANGIADSLPDLIPTIVDVILQIVDTLTDPTNLSNLLDAAIAIILALANGLIDSLPDLLAKAPEIIGNLVTALIDAAPKLLEAALKLILKLAEGLGSFFYKITEKGREIVDSIKAGFQEKVDKAKEWGQDLINNFVDGITQKWENLKANVTGIAQTIKNLLGFSEPKEGPLSNFHTYAPDMMMLFAKGIRDNENLVRDQLEDSFNLADTSLGAWEANRLNTTVQGAGAYRFGGASGATRGAGNAETLTAAITEALRGCGVYMDGQVVGRLVTKAQANTARAIG